MTTRIIGTGSCLPQKIVTNDDLAQIVDTNDEWIASRTGIRERRIACEETTVSLAVGAAKAALEDSGKTAEEIDLIIVATCSPESFFPSTSCQVQEQIGASHAVAFDLSAACSGFLFAFNTAHAYIQSEIYQNALIIGAETLSKLIDWKDRGTCVLFGDGAGAVVVQADEAGYINMFQQSDGAKGDVLTCNGRPVSNLLNNQSYVMDYIAMDGQEVFKFAVKRVPECIKKVFEGGTVSMEDVKYFVLHQANSRIIQSVAKRLHIPEEKFPMNLECRGNTSAASIPILLDEMNKKGMLERGDKILMSGFGAGLTWGASLLEW